MNNRKKLIELFTYVLIVVSGIILLFTNNLKEPSPYNGGVNVVALSFK